MLALQRRSENNHCSYYSLFSFCLIKKKEKIKKVRMLHKGRASLQRGLSFLFVTEIFFVVMGGALVAKWFTIRS
jgi:hypothetical protein